MSWQRALGLLVVVGLPALAAPAVTLRYKYEAGETVRYHDHLALAFEADASVGQRRRLQLRSDSRIEQTVREAGGDGFVIEMKTVSNKTERIDDAGERDTSENVGPPERIRMRPNGRVTERRELNQEGPKQPSAGLVTPLDEFAIIQQVFDHLTMPEGEVEPGAEWTSAMTINLTPDTDQKTEVELEPKTTFTRLVTVRGHPCAELVTDFVIALREPSNPETRELNVNIDGQILGHLVSYFAVERGRAILELATLGAHGQFSISPPGSSDKLTVRGRLKCNLKTVLED